MNNGEDWSAEELKAAVQSYLEMLMLYLNGEPFVKKEHYRRLATRFGRTEKACEYRAQNISYVLALLGRQWLPGLPPARHVGSNVTATLESLLSEAEGFKKNGIAEFESMVLSARRRKHAEFPRGCKSPGTKSTASTTYERDPEVKAWVLEAAQGNCELCKEPAPFKMFNEVPFLEVHHVRQLADKGSDTVTNAVAICPNCHRALHYSLSRQSLIDALFSNVPRLVRE